MLVLGIIAYALPQMTGRKLYRHWTGEWAFWTSNIGMLGMTGAFAVAGITQVYLERRMGMDFLAAQEAISVHFIGLVLAATLFTVGIVLYIWNFILHGLPTDEAIVSEHGAAETAEDADPSLPRPPLSVAEVTP
jgi:nitric oxide reductase subunit B